MDYATFSKLTRVTLSSAEQTDFSTIEDTATKQLERLLGYPLDPSDWPNLYNETGKTQAECICPDVDNTLDSPDAVVGKYRLFNWYPTDLYVPIDPATAINRVKLIREDVTYKTFDEDEEEVAVKWQNGSPKVTKYLDLRSCSYIWRKPCWRDQDFHQIAVDATWAYTTLPSELEMALAKLIADIYKGAGSDDILSESRGSHSYTKRDRQTAAEKYPELMEFAGPNGTLKTRVL